MTTITGGKGLRNDVPVERFSDDDLAEAKNIDIDESAKIYRRLGTTKILSGAMHSLANIAGNTYMVKDNVLGITSADGAFNPLYSPVYGRVRYTAVDDVVFWTDGVDTKAIRNGVVTSAGLTVPTLPDTSLVSGAMRAGTYLYTVVAVRYDGVESGARSAGVVILNNTSGIQFDNIPTSTDPSVTHMRIYVSQPNGELMYAAITEAVGVSSAVLQHNNANTLPLRTQFKGPPPAGEVLGYYNGRLYVASGRFLWYSEPYEYELFDLMNGFIAFDSPIKTFAAVTTGIYLGTDSETLYLSGPDPLEFVSKQVAAYGTVLGTELLVRNDLVTEDSVDGVVALWCSKQGMCIGMENGVTKNLTSSRYVMPAVKEGASLLKIRSGTPQMVTTLYN